MNRSHLYIAGVNDPKTFAFDEILPSLPLPELEDTMQRYYESLRPFGSEEQLEASRKVIAEFSNGVGAKLHAKLKEYASQRKNWVEVWWDKYGYHMLRCPLKPYTVMAQCMNLDVCGITMERKNYLKNLARILFHTIEFWKLLREEKIKPFTSHGGQILYSSSLYKRFYSTTRVPGIETDHVESHFRTEREGPAPSHCVISGKGRLFVFDTLHPDGSMLSALEILLVLQRLHAILAYEPMGDCVPMLTHDDRTRWARNRQYLRELTSNNEETLKVVESSTLTVVLDDNEPTSYEEVAQAALFGDYHSSWADRSSTTIAYRSGRFASIGEHSSYDGTISVSYTVFIQLSLMEVPEPDWLSNEAKNVNIRELRFDLDETLTSEISRMRKEGDEIRDNVIVTYEVFTDYGKDFIKMFNMHPDSYVQVVMQIAYAKLHNDIAPTYETALMRHYHNGRTEVLRSCTLKVKKCIEVVLCGDSTKQQIVSTFKEAAHHHNYLMEEARKGHGVDRHLFGLWCIAHEENMEIPSFYQDPLYLKSGGGGNFLLSTSTLGNTVNVGFVSPMTLDGYGVFYTITSQMIYIQTTAFRDSTKTSARKFNEAFQDALQLMASLLKETSTSKL